MTPFPNLNELATFPSFAGCPLAAPPPQSPDPSYFLLGTIHENMTLSSTPTFICKDRSSASFALKIILPMSTKIESFDYKKFKKGCTVVVKDARRSGVIDGKQGFIETRLDNVQIIPTSVEKMLDLSNKMCRLEFSDNCQVSCQACGLDSTKKPLLQCKGCESVKYCSKECQKVGWGEKGHKSECKIFKAVGDIDLGNKLIV